MPIGSDIDWRSLKPALLRLGVVAVVAGMLVAASAWFRHQHQSAYETSESEYQSVRGGYRDVQEALRIMRSDYARFQSLERVGFLGHEPRLNWVENIRGIAVGLGLPGVRYHLSPRQVYPHPLIANTHPFDLNVTRMTIDARLGHEGELLSFFDQLRARDNGLFDIQHCKLGRIHDSEHVVFSGPNLHVHCELNWYSLTMQAMDMVEEEEDW